MSTTRSQNRLYFLTAAVLLAVAANVRADLFRDIGGALGAAGFTLEGQRNFLSGGTELAIRRNLQGNALDFGAWDLTLQGPVALEASTGGRYLPQFDLRLSTSRGDGAAPAPLRYTLNYDVGGQEAQITGSLLTDVDFSLNRFGFYDLGITYSSRQDVLRDGRFANEQQQFDFDLGPMQVSGNVFADLLAIVTEPIFQAAGVINPFTSFSGNAQLAGALDTAGRSLVEQLAAGKDVTAVEVRPGFNTDPGTIALSRDAPVGAAQPSAPDGVVPEPSVLALLALGIPLLVGRRMMTRRIAQ